MQMVSADVLQMVSGPPPLPLSPAQSKWWGLDPSPNQFESNAAWTPLASHQNNEP